MKVKNEHSTIKMEDRALVFKEAILKPVATFGSSAPMYHFLATGTILIKYPKMISQS